MNTGKIVLGNTYKHTRLPIEGTATAYTHYLTGCNQVCLERMVSEKIEHDWFDETNIEGVSVTVEESPGADCGTAPAPG